LNTIKRGIPGLTRFEVGYSSKLWIEWLKDRATVKRLGWGRGRDRTQLSPVERIRALSEDQLTLAVRYLHRIDVPLPRRVGKHISPDAADIYRDVGDVLNEALELARLRIPHANPRVPDKDEEGAWLAAEKEQVFDLALRVLAWLINSREEKMLPRAVVLSEHMGTPHVGDGADEHFYQMQRLVDEETGKTKGAPPGSSGFCEHAELDDTNLWLVTKRLAKNPVNNIRVDTPAFGEDADGFPLLLRRLGLKADLDSSGYQEWYPVQDLRRILIKLIRHISEHKRVLKGHALVIKTNLFDWGGKALVSSNQRWPHVLVRIPTPMLAWAWANTPRGDGVLCNEAHEAWNAVQSMTLADIKTLEKRMMGRRTHRLITKSERRWLDRLTTMRRLIDGTFNIDRTAVIDGQSRPVLSVKTWGPIADDFRQSLGLKPYIKPQKRAFQQA